MRLLVKNIARIVGIESTGRLRCCGADMNKLGMLDDAWLLAEDGRFAAFGRMDSLGDIAADEAYLARVVKQGAEKARASASATVADVRRIMGIKPF